MTPAHRLVVQRAEAYVRASRTSLPVSGLCRAVGVSERGLREAFRHVRGITPKRYMLDERLRAVRRALTDAAAPASSVTEVAIRHGFSELGRFAGCYRQAFGETPSETLRSRRR